MIVTWANGLIVTRPKALTEMGGGESKESSGIGLDDQVSIVLDTESYNILDIQLLAADEEVRPSSEPDQSLKLPIVTKADELTATRPKGRTEAGDGGSKESSDVGVDDCVSVVLYIEGYVVLDIESLAVDGA